MSSLLFESKNSVGYIKLNRPELKNAMDANLIQALKKKFLEFQKKTDLRALVISGESSFFCAGGDLNWMKSSIDKSKAENEADARELGSMIRALDECPLPVICLVEGGAFGGGVGLVAASDIVIAEVSAKFSLSEVKLGLIPATIGPLVLRKIGISQARRLYLTGLRFSGEEAQRIGLVHELAKDKSEMDAILNRYLRELASSGPEAVRYAKSLIREMQGRKVWDADISEESSKILSEIRVGAEAQEGISAFLEKRSPSWRTSLTEV